MEMCKAIFAVARFFLLIIGFSLVCLGAFYVSTSYACNCGNDTALAYSLLPLGFILLLIGIFWSTYHEVNHKSLFHTMIRQYPRPRARTVETVDRPDFYPPSYEQSQDLENQHYAMHTDHVQQADESYNLPPPLYTESSLEVIQETSGHLELPPSYEASLQQQQQPDTAPVSGVMAASCSGDTTGPCDSPSQLERSPV